MHLNIGKLPRKKLDIWKAFPPVREPAQHDLYAVYIALMKSGLATYLPRNLAWPWTDLNMGKQGAF